MTPKFKMNSLKEYYDSWDKENRDMCLLIDEEYLYDVGYNSFWHFCGFTSHKTGRWGELDDNWSCCPNCHKRTPGNIQMMMKLSR